MPLIHTVTLNPAIDICEQRRYPAGKGITVSRALAQFGISSELHFLCGGTIGEELKALLLAQGLTNIHPTAITAETRTTTVYSGTPERKHSTQSPPVDSSELEKLIEQLDSSVQPGDTIVLSGSLPQNVDPAIYSRLTHRYQEKSSKVIVDTSDHAAFQAALAAGPFMMKGNETEWGCASTKKLTTLREKVDCAYFLQTRGAQCAKLYCAQGNFNALPPTVTISCTVGSGDSATAGFLYAHLKNMPDPEKIRYAIAAGSASAMKRGTEVCTLEEMNALAHKVSLHVLPTPLRTS